MSPSDREGGLERLSQLVVARLGLDFPASRRADLERGLLAAARELAIVDVDRWLAQLVDAPWSPTVMDALAGGLTIGETYFFRDPSVFRALLGIVQGIVDRRATTDRRLRIWCAGCSTGEEPYSLAMLLESAIPDIERWDIRILATDINVAALRKAREGLYTQWSFRSDDASARARYFTAEGAKFRLIERVRRRVTFTALNLADNVYPSPVNGTTDVDVIFCRNVLMYFSAAQAARVAKRLTHSLADGGWLIVSPVEATPQMFGELAVVNSSDSILFQRRLIRSGIELSAATPLPMPPPQPVPAPQARPVTIPERPEPPPTLEVDWLHEARVAADVGRLADALDSCDRAIAENKLDPRVHYLRAVVLDQLGRGAEATASLRAAVFVAPDFALAYFMLARLAWSERRIAAAQRHLDRVLAIPQESPQSALESVPLTHLHRLALGMRAMMK